MNRPVVATPIGRWTGFTAIELLTVITVIGILAAVGLPAFNQLMATTRVKGASTNVFLALTKARSEAIQRNVPVTLARTGGTWDTGWSIFLDANGNGAVDGGETILGSQGAIKNVTITSNPANLASLVYLNSGRMRNNATPTFSLAIAGRSWMQRCISTGITGSPIVRDTACP